MKGPQVIRTGLTTRFCLSFEINCMLKLGLKWMVNLLSGYPDANICRYPTDSDIIKLAIYFKFISTSSAKYSISISTYTWLVSIKISNIYFKAA